MDSKKIHYKLLWTALSLCSFIYIDIYLIPSKYQSQTVVSKWKSVSQSRRYGGTWYWMETNVKKYEICPELYEGLEIGQPVLISKSLISTSYRKIEENAGALSNTCDISFIQDSGFVYLTFIMILTVIFMIVYEKIQYKPGRKHLTIYLLLSAIALLCLHIFN